MIRTLLLLVLGWFLVAAVLLALAIISSVTDLWGIKSSTMLMYFTIWLGIGVVAAITLGVVLKFVITRFFKALKDLPVPDEKHFLINLVPADQLAHTVMNNDERASKFIKQLSDSGFIEGNYYRSDELPNITMFGCRHPSRDILGVVYLMPGLGAWVDIANDFEDGQDLTVTNATVPETLDRRPGSICVRDPETDVPGLLSQYEKNRPDVPPVQLAANSFTQHFEWQWWRDMTWRKDKGFSSKEEVERIANAPMPGKNPGETYTQEEADYARNLDNQQWKEAWEQVPDKICQRYIKPRNKPDDDFDSDDNQARLVVSFDGQSLTDFQFHLNKKITEMAEFAEYLQESATEDNDPDRTQTFKPSGFNPRVDGYKLQAAAEAAADGLAAAEAIAKKYPAWFKAVHTGNHPMTYVIYELPG